MRFQILPIWEGQRETVFTHTSLFSLREQLEPQPSEKSQVWLWNRICQDWLQLWAQYDAFASLQKLSAETYHLHWYPTGETGCVTLGYLIKTKFHQTMLCSYLRMFVICLLWWLWIAICGSCFICVEMNYENWIMYAADSSFNVGRQHFSIQRGEKAQVEWATAICKLSPPQLYYFEVGVISKFSTCLCQS